MLSKIKTLLYIFQLAEYDILFFKNWVKKHPDLENYLKIKKEPVWTFKAKLIFVLAILFSPFYLIFPDKLYYSLILSSKFIKPLETFIVFIFAQKTKSKLKRRKDLVKIGIAGSYGKTTTKEYLTAILSSKYRIFKTPENINTLLGIIKLILKELDENYHILITEMAAYKKGDIKNLCKMIKPEIRILTGLNTSHLERFGSLENTIRAKFEIVDNLSQQSRVFLNADDAIVFKNCQQFFKGKPEFYGLNPEIEKVFEAKNVRVSKEGIEFEIFKNKEFYFNAEAKVFGRHQLEPILLAITVADKLGFNKEEILIGLRNIRPLPRRLFLKRTEAGIIVIDDSYNISKNSAEAALEFLKEAFPEKRKIIVTAGILEQGEKKSENNKWLGKKIKGTADLVLMTKNSNLEFLIDGLEIPKNEILEYNEKIESQKQKAIIFDDAQELNINLSKILKPNDVVLIFPYDLPAHYY